MRPAVARWLHRHLPFGFVPATLNNRLSGWSWRWAPDPEAPESVQRWWAQGGQGQRYAPPRFRPRKRHG